MPKLLKQKIKSKENAKDVSFWFVRHGESEGNTLEDDCPVMHDTILTERGKKEAQRVVEYFKKNNVNISDVYTAPPTRSGNFKGATTRGCFCIGQNLKTFEHIAVS